MPPRPVIYVLLLLIALSFVPMAFLVRARVTGSTSPRLQIIPDMDNEPRFKSQQANPLFADGRELRPPVPGAVARTEDRSDPLFREACDKGSVDGCSHLAGMLESGDVIGRKVDQAMSLYARTCEAGFVAEIFRTSASLCTSLSQGCFLPWASQPLRVTSVP